MSNAAGAAAAAGRALTVAPAGRALVLALAGARALGAAEAPPLPHTGHGTAGSFRSAAHHGQTAMGPTISKKSATNATLTGYAYPSPCASSPPE